LFKTADWWRRATRQLAYQRYMTWSYWWVTYQC